MSVDYSKQYRPDQLEPFYPNELIKMLVSVLMTMAAIMALVLLFPEHSDAPANPSVTPEHIKPEWYFLAVYQSLKLMPQTLFGISGKVLGIVVQGAIFLILLTLPFWYRRGTRKPPGVVYIAVVTLVVLSFIILTIWGLWPEDDQGKLVSLEEFHRQHWLFLWSIAGTAVFFYAMMLWEHVAIKRNWNE